MSKDKYKHAMEIIENWDRVEIGFGYPERSWNEAKQSPDSFALSQLNDRALFRIKETPSKVPFGPEDITHDMLFRRKEWTCGWRLCTAVGPAGVSLAMNPPCTTTWEELQSEWLWSINGKTWHPCEKAEKPSPPPPKREPRRVFVNYDKDSLPTNAWSNHSEAVSRSHPDWCSEFAVEFVEVLK